MKFFYAILAVIGIIVLVLAQIRLINQRTSKFSAAQLVAQGRAYKLAFYSMLAYALIYAFFDAIGFVWCETVAGLLFGVFLGLAVFIMAAIHFDAYEGCEPHNGLWFYGSLLAIVLCIVSFVISLIKGTFMIDGKLSYGSCALFAALLWAAIIVTQHYHYGYEYEDEDDDDEDDEE